MADDKELTGIPISALIAAPLAGAADASLRLAEASANYIAEVGFIQRGPREGEPRQVEFMFERPRQDANGDVFVEEVHIQVPLLAIAPAPNLQIESVDVEFSLEIRSTSSEKQADKTKVTEDYVQLYGATATHKEQTRDTDKSSKYHFELHATNHGVPETLARILDMMASGVAPRRVEKKAEDGKTEGGKTGGGKTEGGESRRRQVGRRSADRK